MLNLLLNLVLTASSTTAAGHSPSALQDADLKDLSLLPLDKLLAVKKALSYKDIDYTEAVVNISSTSDSQAHALRGDPGSRGTLPPRRGGPPIWVEEVEVWKGSGGGGGHGGKGKGALQGIFQGTVTVLAFLAFGGYLLCLVMLALREKTAALEMTLLTTVAPATRRRRTLEPGEGSDRMYATLQTLSEAYVKYNQKCLHDS